MNVRSPRRTVRSSDSTTQKKKTDTAPTVVLLRHATSAIKLAGIATYSPSSK